MGTRVGQRGVTVGTQRHAKKTDHDRRNHELMKRLVACDASPTNTSNRKSPSGSALELGKAAVMQDTLAGRTRTRRKTEDLDPSNTKSFLRQTSSSSQKMNNHVNGDSLGGGGGGSRGVEHKSAPGRRTDAGPTKASGAGGGVRKASQGAREGRQSQVFERLAKVDSNKSNSSGRGGGRSHHQQEGQNIRKMVGGKDSLRSSTHTRRKHYSPSHSSCSSGRSSVVGDEEKDSFTEKQEQENMPETIDKDLDDISPPPPPPPPVSSSTPTSSHTSHHTTTPTSHHTSTPSDAAPSHPKSPISKTLQKKSTTKVEAKRNSPDGGSRGLKVRRATRPTTEQREEASGGASRSEVLERVRARVGDGRTQEAGEVRDADKDVCEADVADEEKEFYKISVRTRLVTYDNNTLVIRNTSKSEDACEEETEEETEHVKVEDEASDSSTTPHQQQQEQQQATTTPDTDLQTSSEEVVETAVGGLGDVECGSSPTHTSINPPHQQQGAVGGGESGRVAGVKQKLTLLVNRGRVFLSEFYSATQNRLEQYTRPDHSRGRSDSGYFSLPRPLVEVNPLWSQEQEILRRGYGAYPSMQVPLFRPVQCRGGQGDSHWSREVSPLHSRHTDTEYKSEHDCGMTGQVTEDGKTEDKHVSVNKDEGEGEEAEGCATIIVDEEWIKKNILCTCQCRQRREVREGRVEQSGEAVKGSSRRGGVGGETIEGSSFGGVGDSGIVMEGVARGTVDDGTINTTENRNEKNKKPASDAPIEPQQNDNSSNNNTMTSETLVVSETFTTCNSIDTTSTTTSSSSSPSSPSSSSHGGSGEDTTRVEKSVGVDEVEEEKENVKRTIETKKSLVTNDGKEIEKQESDEGEEEEEKEKVKEGSEDVMEEEEEDLCFCSCHEGEEGRGAVLPHHLPQEVQDLLDADHARMWWTITGNFGNILPIDWSKTYTRQQYLPVLNLNQMKEGGGGGGEEGEGQGEGNGGGGEVEEEEEVAQDLDLHHLILTGLTAEPVKSAEEVIQEIDDIMQEGSSSEDEGLEESSPSTDSMNDPPTRPCPPHLYADKLRSMSVGALNETLMELEVVVRQYSETLISQLALRDELEYEKELKNSFISLLLQVQNKRRNFNVEKKKQKKVGPNGTDPKYLTTVIPYDVGHGPPLNTTLQILIKILTAINEDSPTVPTLLTDYILKVLCPS
ncbi:hypothetical protein Pcinc_021327 [Petrolisthes cinctipes]|uniref:Fasciculation and elongation protein zeta-2 n=1 Tax=Petrolisthes cinctipes TaxID=88211 RepID=A0AAE1FH85_PETCI|nr:hypothetical protein Pcinc_021327 [Petrolisthes cinctipes]